MYFILPFSLVWDFPFMFMVDMWVARISLAYWDFLSSEGTSNQHLFEFRRTRKLSGAWTQIYVFKVTFGGKLAGCYTACKSVSQRDAGKLTRQWHFKGEVGSGYPFFWFTEESRKLQDLLRSSNPERKDATCCRWDTRWTVQVAHPVLLSGRSSVLAVQT